MKTALKELFASKNPYGMSESNALFLQALKENVAWHEEHCEDYARILESFRFDSSQLTSISDIYRLPAIPTSFLKRHPLVSMPYGDMRLRATTSGTSGEPMQVGYDKAAIPHGFRMLARLVKRHRLISFRPSVQIVLSYKPPKGIPKAFVRTASVATILSPSIKKVYALGPYRDDGNLEVDFEGLAGLLRRCAAKNTPVRIFGQTALLYFLLAHLQEAGFSERLNPNSLVLVGGGFKEFYGQQVSQDDMFAMADKSLGIRRERFLQVFAAAEHAVAYFQCENHHFHVPIYSRVLVRDFQTLAPLGYGEPGLLNLISPLLKSMPLSSILTDDVAVLKAGHRCGCGLSTPYFEILGRAGMAEIKTCAQTIQEAWDRNEHH